MIVVMYVVKVPNRGSPPAILLRESYREAGKVKNRTLANLSAWPEAKVEALARVLKGQPPPAADLDGAFEITRSLPHGHVAAVLGTARQLGLEELIDPVPSRHRDLGPWPGPHRPPPGCARTSPPLTWTGSPRCAPPSVKALVRDGDLQLTLFDQADLAEITSPDFPGELGWWPCMNPFLEAERARKRESLLAATEADLGKIAAACARTRAPLRGTDKIAVRADRVLSRRKVAKHFTIEITDDSLPLARDQRAEQVVLVSVFAASAPMAGSPVTGTGFPDPAVESLVWPGARPDGWQCPGWVRSPHGL